MWWQMIVVTWAVSLAEMSSSIMMSNMKVFYKFWYPNQDEIHIVKYNYPGTKNNKILNVLKQSLLDQNIKDGYNIIHLGRI